jgi:hypothetical protein
MRNSIQSRADDEEITFFLEEAVLKSCLGSEPRTFSAAAECLGCRKTPKTGFGARLLGCRGTKLTTPLA